MKYLKLFEEIDFTLDKNKFVYLYNTTIQNIPFYVRFLATIKNNVYIRRYGKDSTEEEFKTGYGKKEAILSGITEITLHFIEDVNPNCIVIPHMSMIFEEGKLEGLNKRAKMNYEYLKNISGYHLEYYNSIYLSNKVEKTLTYCFIIKDGYTPDINLLMPSNREYKKVII
jgi:hypothetical protein